METKLNNTMDIRGSDFSMTISQFDTGALIEQYFTEVRINKFNNLGNAKDQKKFIFTQEEFECFIKCLEANDIKQN